MKPFDKYIKLIDSGEVHTGASASKIIGVSLSTLEKYKKKLLSEYPNKYKALNNKALPVRITAQSETQLGGLMNSIANINVQAIIDGINSSNLDMVNVQELKVLLLLKAEADKLSLNNKLTQINIDKQAGTLIRLADAEEALNAIVNTFIGIITAIRDDLLPLFRDSSDAQSLCIQIFDRHIKLMDRIAKAEWGKVSTNVG